MNKYPYTTYNEYNLDWLIRKVKEFEHSLTDFEALHSITFGGDWDISKSYLQWTIVSDPATHDGYLSIKPVPANILLSNSEYWLKIADYTTGLANVNDRVDQIENDISDNIKPVILAHGHDITALDNDYNALNNDINNIIRPAIESINDDINNNIRPEIQNIIDTMGDRKILIFGDSYFLNSPIGSGQSVLYYLNQYKKNNNFTFDLKADGREGFSIASPDSFEYDVQQYASVFSADEVTDIIFAGGYNDRVNGRSAIESGMNVTFAAVRVKYPNAKIHVGHFGWNGATSGANREQVVYNSIPAYTNAAKYGASYMCNSEFTMHDYDLFESDYIHPTDAGRQEIAKQIINYLICGTCDVHYGPKSVTYNDGGPAGSWTNTQYTVSSKLDNDQVTIYLPAGAITYTTPPFNIGTSPVALLGLDYPNYPGYRLHFMGNWTADRNASQFPLIGNFVNADRYFDFSDCSFFIKEGSLFVISYKLASDGSGFETISNVYEIYLNGQAITIPSLQC